MDETSELQEAKLIKKFEHSAGRAETGPMQFDEDWPGLFIRGDQAQHFGYVLAHYIENDKNILWIDKAVLDGLANLLKSCHAKNFEA